MVLQFGHDLPQLGCAEPVAFAQRYRTMRTIQCEHGLPSSTNHMCMRRRMVIRVEHDP